MVNWRTGLRRNRNSTPSYHLLNSSSCCLYGVLMLSEGKICQWWHCLLKQIHKCRQSDLIHCKLILWSTLRFLSKARKTIHSWPCRQDCISGNMICTLHLFWIFSPFFVIVFLPTQFYLVSRPVSNHIHSPSHSKMEGLLSKSQNSLDLHILIVTAKCGGERDFLCI